MKTRTFKAITLTLLLISIVSSTYGQVSQGGTPYSLDPTIKTKEGKPIKSNENLKRIIMPRITQTQVDSIRQINRASKEVFQFAYSFETNIDIKTSATIDTLDIGILFRYEIESEGAYSLNIIFSEYEIPRGSKVFIYNLSTKHIVGAFTSDNNKQRKVLPTVPVKGDKIIIEYFEPLFPDFEGKLKIGKISHDFMGFYKQEKNFGSSGDCNIDINCPLGNNWQNEKRAVCKIVIGGNGLCSGALVNNTNEDGTPYFLTANHCISTEYEATNSVFIFNYESSTCSGADGSQSQSISGAELRATRSVSDFTLLQLSKTPLSTYNPFFAGWDNQNLVKNNVVGIHHPAGDVKKICVDNDNIQSTAYHSNLVDVDANHWRVVAWDEGITEGGSSGSPLFDNDGKIIGQLHGGNAACDGEDNNGLSDWYGKFSTSWNEGGSSASRLRDWLDPANNVMIFNGITGCGQGTNVNLNITHTITSGTVELHQATNNITASNIIEAGATATYEAGNTIVLEPDFMAEVGSTTVVQIVNSNCVVTCDPMNLVTWTSFVCRGEDLCFFISNASNYNIKVQSITGTLIYQNSGIVTSSSVCVWNTTGVASAVYNVTVTFISDCQEISNTYQLLITSCEKPTNNEPGNENKDEPIKKIDSVVDTTKLDFDFSVFPNPNDGSFLIIIHQNITYPYSFEILNSIGKQIYNVDHLNANQISVSQIGLPKGVYFIRIRPANSVATKKVTIQ